MEGEGPGWVSQSCEKKTAVEDSYKLWAADSCEGNGLRVFRVRRQTARFRAVGCTSCGGGAEGHDWSSQS